MTCLHYVQLERIRRAIAALPDRPRQVFTLHVIEALDFTAIANRLELGIDEVERALADAIYLIDRDLRRQDREGMR